MSPVAFNLGETPQLYPPRKDGLLCGGCQLRLKVPGSNPVCTCCDLPPEPEAAKPNWRECVCGHSATVHDGPRLGVGRKGKCTSREQGGCLCRALEPVTVPAEHAPEQPKRRRCGECDAIGSAPCHHHVLEVLRTGLNVDGTPYRRAGG